MAEHDLEGELDAFLAGHQAELVDFRRDLHAHARARSYSPRVEIVRLYIQSTKLLSEPILLDHQDLVWQREASLRQSMEGSSRRRSNPRLTASQIMPRPAHTLSQPLTSSNNPRLKT